MTAGSAPSMASCSPLRRNGSSVVLTLFFEGQDAIAPRNFGEADDLPDDLVRLLSLVEKVFGEIFGETFDGVNGHGHAGAGDRATNDEHEALGGVECPNWPWVPSYIAQPTAPKAKRSPITVAISMHHLDRESLNRRARRLACQLGRAVKLIG